MNGMDSIIGIIHDVHYLRIDSKVFKNVKYGDKQLKAKINDNYKIGDTLILEELSSKGRYSGDWTPKEIIEIHAKEELVILRLKDIKV